ncbi:MAG: FeoB-associated Cys-rich membrane protein [Desulfotignum sp.]|nr:FeoB-associated Cys-rich membrane protein [Desulfotignum sp.]MCF8124814.1 FeoB-associated Cys-rich membrane protein [Desulfotignum sp.]
MLEKIIISTIVAGAVYYLYRRFKMMSSADGTSCGCDGCGPAESECEKKTLC